MGWVTRGSFLGKVVFDSGFERRKNPGWVEWGEGIPKKGVAVRTPSPGVSLKESQYLGDRMAVSGVLRHQAGRTGGKGKRREGFPGSSREKRSGFHNQKSGSRFSLLQPALLSGKNLL